MPAHEDFVPNNALYAESFDKGHLSLPPARKLIVVTCMDARLEPASQLGLKLGDAHVIRNAGGSARDALRSVIISQRLLGTREIAVVKHTDCGMTTFTTEDLRNQIIEVSPGDSAVATAVKEIDFLEFSQLEEAVKGDVKFLRENPLVLRDIPISGWIYDVKKGEIQPVSW
ncbi:carbonic anhydrase [Coprinopsis sp. MPI-PUGE-AT-0042]|nr:carbonic anhydrase [Coprinopsis sp. MPI-PUGE-AT-0042]